MNVDNSKEVSMGSQKGTRRVLRTLLSILSIFLVFGLLKGDNRPITYGANDVTDAYQAWGRGWLPGDVEWGYIQRYHAMIAAKYNIKMTRLFYVEMKWLGRLDSTKHTKYDLFSSLLVQAVKSFHDSTGGKVIVILQALSDQFGSLGSRTNSAFSETVAFNDTMPYSAQWLPDDNHIFIPADADTEYMPRQETASYDTNNDTVQGKWTEKYNMNKGYHSYENFCYFVTKTLIDSLGGRDSVKNMVIFEQYNEPWCPGGSRACRMDTCANSDASIDTLISRYKGRVKVNVDPKRLVKIWRAGAKGIKAAFLDTALAHITWTSWRTRVDTTSLDALGITLLSSDFKPSNNEDSFEQQDTASFHTYNFHWGKCCTTSCKYKDGYWDDDYNEQVIDALKDYISWIRDNNYAGARISGHFFNGISFHPYRINLVKYNFGDTARVLGPYETAGCYNYGNIVQFMDRLKYYTLDACTGYSCPTDVYFTECGFVASPRFNVTDTSSYTWHDTTYLGKEWGGVLGLGNMSWQGFFSYMLADNKTNVYYTKTTNYSWSDTARLRKWVPFSTDPCRSEGLIARFYTQQFHILERHNRAEGVLKVKAIVGWPFYGAQCADAYIEYGSPPKIKIAKVASLADWIYWDSGCFRTFNTRVRYAPISPPDTVRYIYGTSGLPGPFADSVYCDSMADTCSVVGPPTLFGLAMTEPETITHSNLFGTMMGLTYYFGSGLRFQKRGANGDSLYFQAALVNLETYKHYKIIISNDAIPYRIDSKRSTKYIPWRCPVGVEVLLLSDTNYPFMRYYGNPDTLFQSLGGWDRDTTYTSHADTLEFDTTPTKHILYIIEHRGNAVDSGRYHDGWATNSNDDPWHMYWGYPDDLIWGKLVGLSCTNNPH
jgi:hypothetical protein